MKNADALIGNTTQAKEKHCLAKEGEIYLVQLAYVPISTLDLKKVQGDFTIEWLNPVTGGKLTKGSTKIANGGKVISLGNPTWAGQSGLGSCCEEKMTTSILCMPQDQIAL
jgi:hypothetical protein